MTVFVDSNLPMYVAGGDHPNRGPALRFLGSVRGGEVLAVTSTEVLQEILYRYSGVGRVDLATQVYDLFVELCPQVLPVTLADTDRARDMLGAIRGVSTRDLVHAAVMLNAGVTQIATFDEGFDAVPGIERIRIL